jgi:hypothetical protein
MLLSRRGRELRLDTRLVSTVVRSGAHGRASDDRAGVQIEPAARQICVKLKPQRLHPELELELASFKGYDACILFASQLSGAEAGAAPIW